MYISNRLTAFSGEYSATLRRIEEAERANDLTTANDEKVKLAKIDTLMKFFMEAFKQQTKIMNSWIAMINGG